MLTRLGDANMEVVCFGSVKLQAVSFSCFWGCKCLKMIFGQPKLCWEAIFSSRPLLEIFVNGIDHINLGLEPLHAAAFS